MVAVGVGSGVGSRVGVGTSVGGWVGVVISVGWRNSSLGSVTDGVGCEPGGCAAGVLVSPGSEGSKGVFVGARVGISKAGSAWGDWFEERAQDCSERRRMTSKAAGILLLNIIMHKLDFVYCLPAKCRADLSSISACLFLTLCQLAFKPSCLFDLTPSPFP